MRFAAAIRIILSEDDDQIQRELDIDQVTDDTLPTKFKRGVLTLATSETDTQFVFTPEVTNAKYLIVHVKEGTVSVKLNADTAFALTLEPNPLVTPDPVSLYQKTAQPAVYFVGPIAADVPLNTIYLSNPSATVEARVAVAVIGEAT